MAPTILIVGATGNTGQSVVETLSNSINTSKALAGHRIIALTRSSESATAQTLAKLPNVSIEVKNWVDISADWLREHNVVKAFVCVHALILHKPALIPLLDRFAQRTLPLCRRINVPPRGAARRR